MSRIDVRALVSVAAAGALTAFGAFRFVSDILGDANPEFYRVLEGSWLRYAVRAPSDGTFWGDANVQFVKVVSIPCAMSAIYLWYRVRWGSPLEATLRFRQPAITLLWILIFLGAFTVMEMEKAYHLLGLRMAGLLPGERLWVNHALHLASAGIAYAYVSRLSFAPVFPGPQGPRRALR